MAESQGMPGCITQGCTVDAALADIAEAIALWEESDRERR